MKNLFACFVFVILFLSCSKQVFKEQWTTYKSPTTFKAKFETTKGDFIILSERSWSPKAVDRLYQLIKTGFLLMLLFTEQYLILLLNLEFKTIRY